MYHTYKKHPFKHHSLRVFTFSDHDKKVLLTINLPSSDEEQHENHQL